MAYYYSDTIKIPSKFELHYHLRDNSHSIDAFLKHECERELLLIIKQVASLLDIRIDLESEALKEGGIREIWKGTGKNAGQIGLILAAIPILLQVGIMLWPADEKSSELDKVKIEKIYAEIEKLNAQTNKIKAETEIAETETAIKKQELRKLKEEQGESDTISYLLLLQIAQLLQDDYKIVWHRSNFYKKINRNPKVTKIGATLLNEKNEQITPEREVMRDDFRKFIIQSDKIGPNRDEEAEIFIISPVLTKDKFSWKGIYEGEIINFELKDKEFIIAVQDKKVEFVNGTAISCVLHQDRKIDDSGAIIVTKNQVLTVLDVHEGKKKHETKQGTRYRRNKKLLEQQSSMFQDPDFIEKEGA